MELVKNKNENDRKFLVYSQDYCGKVYTEQMLIKNKIEGLVDVRSRNFNGERALYYDITGLRLFSEMFLGDKDRMEARDVKRIAESFCQLSESMDEYLLDIKEVYLRPDKIFYNPSISCYEFIYIPGRYKESKDIDRGLSEELREVWYRVIEKFDYKNNPKDLVYIYGVYQKICSGNSDIKSIFKGYESLNGEDESITCETSKGDTFTLQESCYSHIDPRILEGINRIYDETGDKREEKRESIIFNEDESERGGRAFLKSKLLVNIKKAFFSKLKVIAVISCGISILIIVMLMIPTS